VATPQQVIKLSNMRRVIARRLTEAKTTIPHFYLSGEINVEELLALRSQIIADGARVTINDFLIKAFGMALTEVPEANVQFAGDELISFQRADIAIAVAVPDGILTPVIVDAGAKDIVTIAATIRDLAGRARLGRLREEEFTGGTATLSNLGMYGIRQFNAIINPPQGMILAVGAAQRRPCVQNGELAVASAITVTGSFDHRAIDGTSGARLLAAFQAHIEQPVSLLI
jgi:pyruvate dehydrogenase E2 component (dihydrolipoamide acetyltransferase)